jgi:hypothetical protein
MAFDFSKGVNTSGATRRTSQADVDAARVRAAGSEPAPYDPVKHLQGGREIIDRVQRTVMGRYEIKGRSPFHVLTPAQFSQFTEAGTWEGMPSPEEYGPHSFVPEDKDYE